MAWKDKMPRCFGIDNGIFAAHPIERRTAREMLERALAERASLADIEAEATRYMKSRRLAEEHIREQLRRVRDLRKYFE